jgi:hypothetical protein
MEKATLETGWSRERFVGGNIFSPKNEEVVDSE